MMNYKKLSKKPKRFFRFTGLTEDMFNSLDREIKPLWIEAETKRLSRSNRKRAIGAGRRYKLSSLEDKLLLLLIFYKIYPTYELLGYLFNIDQSNVHRLIRKLEPIISKKVKLPRLPKKQISTLEELQQIYPELAELIIDATEQQIPRPKNKRRRKSYYSGRKKKHTLKTQIVVTKDTGKIVNVSKTVSGHTHDYELFKKTNQPPSLSILYLDKGYQGIQKDYPQLTTVLPIKGNRWHPLSIKDRRINIKRNRIRVKVEHSINRCKRFKLLSFTYRQHSIETYNARFKIIAGLVNLSLTTSSLIN